MDLLVSAGILEYVRMAAFGEPKSCRITMRANALFVQVRVSLRSGPYDSGCVNKYAFAGPNLMVTGVRLPNRRLLVKSDSSANAQRSLSVNSPGIVRIMLCTKETVFDGMQRVSNVSGAVKRAYAVYNSFPGCRVETKTKRGSKRLECVRLIFVPWLPRYSCTHLILITNES